MYYSKKSYLKKIIRGANFFKYFGCLGLFLAIMFFPDDGIWYGEPNYYSIAYYLLGVVINCLFIKIAIVIKSSALSIDDLFDNSAAKLAPEISYFAKFKKLSLKEWFWSSPIITRIVFVAPIFWICSVALYVFLFEPYDYMSDRDYTHMFKVMLFPSFILIAGHMVYSKFISANHSPNDI